MGEADQSTTMRQPPRWAVLTIAAGVALVLLASGGLILLQVFAGQVPASGDMPRLPASPKRVATPTPPDQARIDRQMLPLTTPLPPPPSPTAPTGTPLPPIPWTEAEKNALSWLCYHEVRGMGDKVYDACLSVISTVRTRYAYANLFTETDVISTLRRPGQFNFEFDESQPASAELYWIVVQYQYGARGSCNGFLYFDSVPDGPSLCVIRASSGQWIEFHNGWN